MESSITERGAGKTAVWLQGLIAAILTIAALKALSVIFIPFALAIFAAMLVYPVQERVNARLPRNFAWVGVTAAMVTFVTALTVFSGMTAFILSVMARNIYQHTGELKQYWFALADWASRNRLPLPEDLIGHWGLSPGAAVEILTAGVTSAWSLSAMLLIIFFLTLLMLGETDKWKERMSSGSGPLNSPATAKMIGGIARRVRTFLLLRTAVSVTTGVLGGLWLWATGTDYAFAWAVLIFLLNYIPYIGSIAAVIPPTLLVFAMHGPGQALVVLAGLTVLNQVIGNYLDPRLEGRIFTISPTLVFMSVLFWGWVWGAAGALLAVPIYITLVTVYKHLAEG